MSLGNPNEVFLHDLADVYDATHQFLKGQQEMVQNATDRKLRSAIQEHTEQTRLHIRNLEQIFRELGEEARREALDTATERIAFADYVMRDFGRHSPEEGGGYC